MKYIYDIKSKIMASLRNISNNRFVGRSMAVVAGLFALSLSSCVDDLGVNADPVEENFTGITLLIPNLESAAEYGATRTDGNANTRAYDQAREGNFNTLYIAAIEKNNHNVSLFMKTTSNGIDEENYSKYRINLKEGEYRIYVVANLNRYIVLDGDESATFSDLAKSEDDIRNLILNFSASRPLEPGFLPMACLNENMKVGNKNSKETVGYENYISIPAGEDKYVYADLDFLCSKVRYTILFDRAQAKEFGTADIIDFHRNTSTVAVPFASNIRSTTALIENNSPESEDDTESDFPFIGDEENQTGGSSASTWPLYLDRYNYPVFSDNSNIYTLDEVKDADKIKSAFNAMKLWSSSTDGAWNSETFLNKRAWQGVTYLPENLVKSLESEEDLLTVLNFPYSFNDNEGADSPREIKLKWTHEATDNDDRYGIKRAKSYDVYALVMTPDPSDMRVNVLINPWTVQNLAYELHGPYELVVETSKIETLSMEKDEVIWFRTDVPCDQIDFISPQVSNAGNTGVEMVDLFYGKVVIDANGNPILNDNGDYQFQIGINPNIPFTVIDNLNNGGIEYEEEDGTIHKYGAEDVSYFHIVAGSINKRIEIGRLNLDPYLNVSPQTIIIDTRELYTSGLNSRNYNIEFETNVDPSASNVTFTFTDPDALISGGKGMNSEGTYALRITSPAIYNYEGGAYHIKRKEDKTGSIVLNIRDIITGNPFWDENNEFTLKFRLEVRRDDESYNTVIERPVSIKVKPFTGTYVIHFRDNTKPWAYPHIYVYQDLTLPADMTVVDDNNNESRYEHAGRIVGYIEQNPSSGFQWNAAVQYVFSNNMAFRGWHGSHKAKWDELAGRYVPLNAEWDDVKKLYVTPGDYNEYGGPDLNDPWAPATYTATMSDKNINGIDKETTSTMGFVMFGDPDFRESNVNSNWQNCWNYDYAYNTTYGITPNPQRGYRYNYDINFNAYHEVKRNSWTCAKCFEEYPDYNGLSDERFYTGIAMEPEEDGWWKYTLTGVASPGRTMIIFANWHEPWAPDNRWYDFRAEDYRWPADYEAGLPLFDFEDNDGWFLFDGNTSNSDQKFTDNRPVAQEIPLHFTGDYGGSMQIDIYNPGKIQFTKVTTGYQSKYHTLREEQENQSAYDDEYHALKEYTPTFDTDGDIYTFTLEHQNVPENYEYLVIRLYTSSSNYKEYKVSPKFFVKSGQYIRTAQPLLTQYKDDVNLYVKWNDELPPNEGYWGGKFKDELLFYKPPENGGSNYLNVYWGQNGNWSNKMESYFFNNRDIGNYKYIDFQIKDVPNTDNDKIELRLCTSDGGGDAKYYKVLKAEDLPQYYYPAQKKYLINWHLLPNP